MLATAILKEGVWSQGCDFLERYISFFGVGEGMKHVNQLYDLKSNWLPCQEQPGVTFMLHLFYNDLYARR